MIERALLGLQHRHRNAAIGEVHGDAAAHRAAADDRGLLDRQDGRVLRHVVDLVGLALDEEGKRVLYRNTLQLENLDPNEVEGTIEALSLALAEFASELIGFNKQ